MENPQNPSGEIEFLRLRFGPFVSGIRSVTTNDSSSIPELGGRQMILNIVDICNFMLQASWWGRGGGIYELPFCLHILLLTDTKMALVVSFRVKRIPCSRMYTFWGRRRLRIISIHSLTWSQLDTKFFTEPHTSVTFALSLPLEFTVLNYFNKKSEI